MIIRWIDEWINQLLFNDDDDDDDCYDNDDDDCYDDDDYQVNQRMNMN